MKAIILAAGKGSRITPQIGDIPKSVLPLSDGTPVIRSSAMKMLECGIKPIVCTGYKKECIERALKGLDIKYYYNPFFSVTNNMASLWFTLPEFEDEDIILTSADLYYPGHFLKLLTEADGDICMAMDSSRVMNGDFYFDVRNGVVHQYGPEVPVERRNFEYMGLTKISASLIPETRRRIEKFIEAENYDKYFEDMVICMSRERHYPITFIDVAGSFWREIDFYEDYRAVLEHEGGTEAVQVGEMWGLHWHGKSDG